MSYCPAQPPFMYMCPQQNIPSLYPKKSKRYKKSKKSKPYDESSSDEEEPNRNYQMYQYPQQAYANMNPQYGFSNGYQQSPYQQSPYQQPPYQQSPYQQSPYQQPPYQQPPYHNLHFPTEFHQKSYAEEKDKNIPFRSHPSFFYNQESKEKEDDPFAPPTYDQHLFEEPVHEENEVHHCDSIPIPPSVQTSTPNVSQVTENKLDIDQIISISNNDKNDNSDYNYNSDNHETDEEPIMTAESLTQMLMPYISEQLNLPQTKTDTNDDCNNSCYSCDSNEENEDNVGKETYVLKIPKNKNCPMYLCSKN